MKRTPEKYKKSLKDKKLYMLFQKTSTRTYLSFAQAINELGGNYYSQNWNDSNFTVGDLQTESQYVSHTNDFLMMRLKEHSLSQEITKYSTVPFINGCDNTYHPCQGLADFMTIFEDFQTFQCKLMYIGTKNNVFHSLLELAAKLNTQIYGFTPLSNHSEISDDFYDIHIKQGTYIELDKNMTPDELHGFIQKMDGVYTDTWIDMEFFNNPAYSAKKESICKKMLPYQLNTQLLQGSKALIYHDMPIHVGYEISRETTDAHLEHILNQAENRKHVQKAVLYYLYENQN